MRGGGAGWRQKRRPRGKPEDMLTGARLCGREKGQSECTRHEHGTTSDVCMARYPVAQSRAGGLQAPTAHLPSQSSWRRQDCTQAPATLDEVLVRQTPRDPTGHAGQSWETDCRRGWGHIPHGAPAATPRSTIVPVSEGATGTPGRDSQTWHDGPQALRDSPSKVWMFSVTLCLPKGDGDALEEGRGCRFRWVQCSSRLLSNDRST